VLVGLKVLFDHRLSSVSSHILLRSRPYSLNFYTVPLPTREIDPADHGAFISSWVRIPRSAPAVFSTSSPSSFLLVYLHHRIGPRNEWPWIEPHSHSRRPSSIHDVRRYTYHTFTQLANASTHTDMDMKRDVIIPRRPKSVYHRVKKRDISLPLPSPEFPPGSLGSQYFTRDRESSDFADSQSR
jgi:hypothetical protein